MGLTGMKYRLKSVYVSRLNSGIWARSESMKSMDGQWHIKSDVSRDNLMGSKARIPLGV